ncbi:acyl-CoA dehydrogenase family protein [Nocardia vaccinii]|uniref:acyl-CoA dehydrogenase family protein n=1 Tax=Nocardia vaccinii TaxID=1822 RepID=UPI0009FEC9F4|nr:acyl-CoA dehydrogenase family protein [Nocardia vaccinii]
MTTSSEPVSLRDKVSAEIADCLVGYVAAPPTVLGAGSDDIEGPREFLRVLAPTGWVVPRWPTRFGGRDCSPAEARVVRQVLDSFHPPDLYPFQVGLALVGPALLQHATEEQCARWLPDIKSGATIWCQLFSEPGAGSDLAGLACRAERDGDGWRLTGTKIWSSRAHYADLGIVLARFDSDLPKHAGIVAFAVDMKSSGIDVRPLRQMNGDSHFNEVFLDDVFVPDSSRIDAPGAGWNVARTILGFERQLFGAEGSGTGAGIRQRLVELARSSDIAGRPVYRDRLVRVWCELEVAKLTSRRAAALAASGKSAAAAGAGGKLRMAKNLQAVADLAVDLQGIAGTRAADSWADLVLTSPSLSIRGGTDQIQRNTIAEQVLGLPKEPRVDAGPFSAIDRGRA